MERSRRSTASARGERDDEEPSPRRRFRAPVSGDAERAEFHQRVVFTLRALFILSIGFTALVVATVVVVLGHPFATVVRSAPTAIQFAIAGITFAAWRFARSKRRTTELLDITASTATVLFCWGGIFTCTSGSATSRSELVALFGITCTLALCAALIPSTVARTSALGATALLPILPASYAMWMRTDPASAPRESVYLAIWCVIGLACVTSISHVIYGLRRKARNAMQLGQYLLEAKIGEGGMGVVYRASHAMLRRPTAIKLLSTKDAAALARFEREVQLTASLRHPNTIAIFDYGRTPDGVFYYAMEFLDGITLDDLIHEEGPQPPARVVHILLQVCGSLAEAHAHGLVHRDIKPANLMLSERADAKDVMKVLDFGLVKDTSRIHSIASSANAFVGTPYFMAPEAILRPDQVDRRADVYALGATAYYLLSGRHVFEGASVVDVCGAHVNQPPIPLRNRNPRIPHDLDEVILRCLAKKPADRPDTAQELARLLRACTLPAWTQDDATEAWARLSERPARSARANAARTAITVELENRDTVQSP